jgi:hypothetical protein
MDLISIIEKIHLLESKIKYRNNQPDFIPSEFDSSNINRIQKVAKKIASYIGLENLTFIISYAKQGEKVGGHIQLDHHNEVFIEIDSSLKDDWRLVGAILAHEICHKYLQRHKIQLFPTIENERLTDITTVYTGLGKFSLIGCEITQVDEGIDDSGNRQTTTRKQTVGYLKRKEFAFAYLVICKLRNTPDFDFLNGLNGEVESAIKSVQKEQKHFLDTKTAINQVDKMSTNYLSYQKEYAILNKNKRILENLTIEAFNDTYKKYHSFLNDLKRAKTTLAEEHSKHGLNYIDNLKKINAIIELETTIQKENEILTASNEIVQKAIQSLKELKPDLYSDVNSKFLFDFECPVCNKKMKINKILMASVKCTKCHHEFIIDTGKEIVQSKGKMFNERLKSLFKK